MQGPDEVSTLSSCRCHFRLQHLVYVFALAAPEQDDWLKSSVHDWSLARAWELRGASQVVTGALCAAGTVQRQNLSLSLCPRPQFSWKSPIAVQYPRCCITKDIKGSNDGDPPSLTGSHSDGDCQKARDNRWRNNNGVHRQPRPFPFCRN